MPHVKNDALREEIIRFRHEGLSLRAISARVEVSHQRVHQILCAAGLNGPIATTGSLVVVDTKAIVRLRRLRVSSEEIARRLGCAPVVVRRELRRFGIDTNVLWKTRASRVLNREAEIAAMRRAGASYAEIATTCKVPTSLVARALKNQAPELIRRRKRRCGRKVEDLG